MLSINNEHHMFELKYRPASISECILPKADKEIFLGIVKSGKIPNMLLQSNSPGTGKTTVAKALGNDVDAEVLFVNGSDCKIDFVRNELTQFASSKSIDNKQKVIIIDEFDRSGLAESQRHMRSFIEAYGATCSIIITANNLDGIIKPLQSRLRVIKFGNPTADDKKSMMRDMIKRTIEICENENINVDNTTKRVLAELVKRNFPDFREVIKQLDYYSTNKTIDEGILNQIINDRVSSEDIIQAIKDKDIKILKELSTKYASEYPFFIEKLSNNIYEEVDNASKIRMYEIIGENNSQFGQAANIQVHLMWLLVMLSLEMKWK